MDSLDSVYSSYYLQLLAAQAGQTTQTGTREGTGTSSVSFEDLLASLTGAGGQSATSTMQSYLLSGLADGSINITDSSQFVSAFLSAADGTTGTGFDAMSFLDSIDTSMLSQNTITALMGLQQDTGDEWVQQLVDSLSSSGEEETDALQEYYQALANMAQAQRSTLGL